MVAANTATPSTVGDVTAVLVSSSVPTSLGGTLTDLTTPLVAVVDGPLTLASVHLYGLVVTLLACLWYERERGKAADAAREGLPLG